MKRGIEAILIPTLPGLLVVGENDLIIQRIDFRINLGNIITKYPA